MTDLETKFEPVKYADKGEDFEVESRLDGRRLKRKSVGADKTSGVSDIADDSITNAMLQSNCVSKAKVADDSIGNVELDYEFADITITGTNTSGTATVTSGSIPIGYYLTAFTTPAASYVQLVVSGTTLTATLSTAPGAGNSITIRAVLSKS